MFVLIAGPTVAILEFGGRSILQYARELIPRSIMRQPFNNTAWLNSWTVFYFANWMAWAPLAALFLGKIARGYTVREYIVVNLIIPACSSILWMTIFGGFALNIEMNNPQLLNDIVLVLCHGGRLEYGCYCESLFGCPPRDNFKTLCRFAKANMGYARRVCGLDDDVALWH